MLETTVVNTYEFAMRDTKPGFIQWVAYDKLSKVASAGQFYANAEYSLAGAKKDRQKARAIAIKEGRKFLENMLLEYLKKEGK